MSGLENAIDHDFVDTLVCVDGYLYLNELYSSFLDRNPTTRQRYNFSVFLKTFQGLPLPILTAIAKEIQSLIPSFNPPPSKEPKVRITLSEFHPICLSLKFKTLIPYLIKTDELYLIESIPLPVLYTRLIDELNPNACSIYNPLTQIRRAYESYTIDGHAIDYYLHVSWVELQTYLIKHPSKDLWASKYNKLVENQINQLLKRESKPLEPFTDCAYYERYFGLTLNDEQKQAIQDAVENRFAVLQGNAGCGKSTISMIIADVFTQRGESVLFLTISAKARNLLRGKIDGSFQVVKPDAHTYAWWSVTKEDYDNIIVDEASMIGNTQLLHLLQAKTKRILLMGDAKQILPVCQVGCPFISLQNGTFPIKTSVLTIQNRQSSGNPIVKFVQATVDKEPTMPPEYNGESEGVFYKTLNEDDFLSFYSSFYGKVDFFCIKPTHYQLLSDRIQQAIHQNKHPIRQRKLRVFDSKAVFHKIYKGDPVVRTQPAKYSFPSLTGKSVTVEVPNGTFGVMTKDGVMYNQTHDGVPIVDTTSYVFYEHQLAYAQSAHKTQGSEYDMVLVALHDMDAFRYEGGKNIFYTSITRSKKLLLLCGNARDRSRVIQTMNSDFACPTHTLDLYTFVDLKYNLHYKACHTIPFVPIPDFTPRSNSPFQEGELIGELDFQYGNFQTVLDDLKDLKEDHHNYMCACGSVIKHSSKKAHERTNKHRSFHGL
jgi:energy-coupling factor transporter ATP-binding protein EcfA2